MNDATRQHKATAAAWVAGVTVITVAVTASNALYEGASDVALAVTVAGLVFATLGLLVVVTA